MLWVGCSRGKKDLRYIVLFQSLPLGCDVAATGSGALCRSNAVCWRLEYIHGELPSKNAKVKQMLLPRVALENGHSPDARRNHAVGAEGVQTYLTIASRNKAGQMDVAASLVDQEAVVASGVVVQPTTELLACQLRGRLGSALDPEWEGDDKIDIAGSLDDTNGIPATDVARKGDNHGI